MMALDLHLYYTLYCNFLLIDIDNNEFVNALFRASIKNNGSFLTLLVFFDTFITSFVFVPTLNTSIGRYINKNF